MPNENNIVPEELAILERKLAFFKKELAIGADPERRFQLQERIEEIQTQITSVQRDPSLPPRIDISRLPTPGPIFIGRQAELTHLDNAWQSNSLNAVTVVAWGGVGKSALLDRWISTLAAQIWYQDEPHLKANAVYVWSFYSQGTEERLTSADEFMKQSLRWFGDPNPTEGPARERGERLARLVRRQRTLLILDGLEPLQEPPGPRGGRIKDPGVAALVQSLALDNNGLLLISTRETVADIQRHEVSSVQRLELENFSDNDGAVLLSKLGVVGTEKERRQTSASYHGHALALSLLGTFLVKAHGGEIRKLPDIDVSKADKVAQGGHAWRVIAAYEKWLGQQELAVLRLLGFFDKPAEAEAIDVLRAEPEIDGLNDGLVGMDEDDWNVALSNLAECGLLPKSPNNEEFRPPLPAHAGAWTEAGTSGERAGVRGPLDAHPLIRAYFAHHVERHHPNAWQAGHERLYEHYKNAAPELPDTLDEMMPLYAAVVHGCKAGKHKEAYDEVYMARIRRKNEAYSIKKLGAFGADLVAVGSFFVQRWRNVAPGLSDDDKAWLLNTAGFLLRGLGRLAEAVEPMEASLAFLKQKEDWKQSAIAASNVSELSLTLGNVTRAVASGEDSVALADKSGDAAWRMASRTTLADALHQAGRLEEAAVAFREAEALQEEWQPEYPRLYSLQGYQYCDLLLGRPGLGVWFGFALGDGVADEFAAFEEACEGVRDRALEMLEGDQASGLGILSIALDRLALGRAYLGLSLISPSPQPSPPATESLSMDPRGGGEGAGTGRQRRFRSDNEYLDSEAKHRSLEYLDEAVRGLRASGREDCLPWGLLARAAFHRLQDERQHAEADLNEAEEIAERGGMLLHLADVHLERTALYLQFNENAKARERLDRAVALIEACGYGRRRRDVEYLESVLAGRKEPQSPG